ncbi:MAG: Uma2 family endonuclease [Bacteroidetes bacterium]|nr:MAG: Uma2 family endonuclease [Bacteroidota bacterium]
MAIMTSLLEEQALRQEFYRTVDENRKMEFINGEIIFQPPVKLRHNSACGLLYHLINMHVITHDLGFVGLEKILITLTRNDYEPDICFFGTEKSIHFDDDQMQFPSPDFVVEVLSPSTEKNDRVIKFEDYAAHGVKEYWIIHPEKELVEQYLLSGEAYELTLKSGEGVIRSVAIPGFSIPVRAIFDRKLNRETLAQLVQ